MSSRIFIFAAFLLLLPACSEEETKFTAAHGTVTDTATGFPLEGCEVCVTTREVGACDTTDDDGEFAVRLYDRFEDVALAEGFEICADPHDGTGATCYTIGANDGDVEVTFSIDRTSE